MLLRPLDSADFRENPDFSIDFRFSGKLPKNHSRGNIRHMFHTMKLLEGVAIEDFEKRSRTWVLSKHWFTMYFGMSLFVAGAIFGNVGG